MDNLANGDLEINNYGDHEINNQRRFPPWDGILLLFLSQNHII